MALRTGLRFGAYDILGPLGVRGMGEVYRARDTRLNREVALKVPPGAFSSIRIVSPASRGKPRCSPPSTIRTSPPLTG